MYGLMSRASVLFYWLACLFLCQYYAVFIAAALQHNLKLGMVVLSGVLLLLVFSEGFWFVCLFLAILIFLCSYLKLKIVFSSSVKYCVGILMGILLSYRLFSVG